MSSDQQKQDCTNHEKRSMRDLKAWYWWTLAFALSFVIGGQIFKHADWVPTGSAAVTLSLVPIIPGIFAFLAFLRFFRRADEMVREIFTEGMLFGMGALIIFWGAIQLPEHVWLPAMKANWVVAVMLIGFCIGIARAQWRRK